MSDSPSPAASDSAPAATDDSQAELEALRQQNAELQRQLDQQPSSSTSSGGWRTVTSMIFVFLFAIGLLMANPSVWLATTALETDSFVKTFGPLPDDPAVSAALGQRIAQEVTEQTNLSENIAARLPSDIQFAAAPIAGAIEGLIADGTAAVVSSDVFTSVWEQSLRVSHSAAIKVIEGARDGDVRVQNGQVVLDLNGLLVQVGDELAARGIEGIDLTEVDATIVIAESDELAVIEFIVDSIYTVRWLAPIAALLLLALAIGFASNRRRAVSWLGIAAMVVAIVTLIVLRILRGGTIDSIADPVYQDGAAAAWDVIMNLLIAQTWGLFAIGLIAWAVAWFFGPTDRAVGLRTSFVEARNADRGDKEPTSTTRFFVNYRRPLEFVVIAIGVLILLFVPDLSALVVVVVAALVAAAVAAIEWIGGAPVPPIDSPPDGDEEAGSDDAVDEDESAEPTSVDA